MGTSSLDTGASEVSRKWMIAVVGLVPLFLQAVSYICYKSYYSIFQVRPEEVGYDFASLLGQQAAALVTVTCMAIVFLALVSWGLMWAVSVVLPISIPRVKIPKLLQGKFPTLARFDGDFVDMKVLMFAFLIFFEWSFLNSIADGTLSFLCIPVAVGILVAESSVSRRRSTDGVQAVLHRMSESRSYGPLRIILLSLVAGFAMYGFPAEGADRVNAGVCLVLVALLFDMALLRKGPVERSSGWGSSARLSVTLAVVAVAAASVFAALSGFDRIMRASGMPEAISATASGQGHVASPFDWSSIVIPNAWPVTVAWSSTASGAIPVELAGRNSFDGVLFGQSNGTTVVWWPERQKTLRIPSASVTISTRGNGWISYPVGGPQQLNSVGEMEAHGPH